MPHSIPQSTQAILENLMKTRILILDGAMGTMIQRHNLQEADYRGLRFKDWASETTAFPDAVSEAALAHKDANSVRAAYRRTDFFKLRVELMDAWSAYINAASASDE